MTEDILVLKPYQTSGRHYVICPVCECRLGWKRVNKHLQSVHRLQRVREGFSDKSGRLIKIAADFDSNSAEKGSSRSLRNMQAKILAKRRLDSARIEGTKKTRKKSGPIKKVTFDRSDASDQLAHIRKSLTDDDQINDYLERNPAPDEPGKFGKPQDPYRRSAYGRRSMEYDITREK